MGSKVLYRNKNTVQEATFVTSSDCTNLKLTQLIPELLNTEEDLTLFCKEHNIPANGLLSWVWQAVCLYWHFGCYLVIFNYIRDLKCNFNIFFETKNIETHI